MPGKTLTTPQIDLDLHLPLALSFRQPACRPNTGSKNFHSTHLFHGGSSLSHPSLHHLNTGVHHDG
ncbi:hypothetical protein [Aeromonas salmonicida]